MLGVSSILSREFDPSVEAEVRPADELVAAAVYRLGDLVELDGRISWAPHLPGKRQPLNSYVVHEGDRSYVIDTGVVAQRQTFLTQLEGLKLRGRKLSAFLTRSEYQCSGNLNAVHNAFQLDEVVFGGRNPFAAFDDVSRELQDSVRRTVITLQLGKLTPLASSQDLLVTPAVIRLLGTNWVYSRRNKTLFSSDWFFHTVAPTDGATVIRDLAEDETTEESALQHILCRYFWLPMATTAPMLAWLDEFFDRFEIETIAPTYGCVLQGRPVIEKHLGIVKSILKTVGRS